MRRVAFIFCLLCAAPAWAFPVMIINQEPGVGNTQQQLVSSSPAGGQTLDTPPKAVTLTFSRSLKRQSTIKVQDAFGQPVTDGETAVSGVSMSVPLKALASGRYTVRWKARCQCGAALPDLADSFRFTVK